MKSSFFNFKWAFILVLHQKLVSFQMWETSGIFLLFNRSPFLFNNRCQFFFGASSFLFFLNLPFSAFRSHIIPSILLFPSARPSRGSHQKFYWASTERLRFAASCSPPPPKRLFVIGGRSPSRTWAAIESLGATRIFGKLSVPYLYFFADLRKGRGGRWRLNWICKYV